MGQVDFTHEQAAAYLSAMIDGEGCVEYKRHPSGVRGWRRRVRICNTSEGIIAAVEDACSVLEVHYTKHSSAGTNRPAWIINFPGSSIARLHAVVRLADSGKQERLTAAANYRSAWTRDAAGRINGSEVSF